MIPALVVSESYYLQNPYTHFCMCTILLFIILFCMWEFLRSLLPPVPTIRLDWRVQADSSPNTNTDHIYRTEL